MKTVATLIAKYEKQLAGAQEMFNQHQAEQLEIKKEHESHPLGNYVADEDYQRLAAMICERAIQINTLKMIIKDLKALQA